MKKTHSYSEVVEQLSKYPEKIFETEVIRSNMKITMVCRNVNGRVDTIYKKNGNTAGSIELDSKWVQVEHEVSWVEAFGKWLRGKCGFRIEKGHVTYRQSKSNRHSPRLSKSWFESGKWYLEHEEFETTTIRCCICGSYTMNNMSVVDGYLTENMCGICYDRYDEKEHDS